MKLKSALFALLLSVSASSQELIFYKNIGETYNEIITLEKRFTKLEFGNLQLDIRKKQAKYPLEKSFLYFNLREWNGKPLYLITYRFYLEDVPAFVRWIRGASQGGADKEIKDYQGEHENNSSSFGYWMRDGNIH